MLHFLSSTLDLSKNNITLISDDNFKGQQNLLELNLSKNKMDQIPSGTFKYLVVSCRSTSKISVASFRFSQDLRSLNLADNSIEDLQPKTFHMLTKLKSLDLSRNPLEDLHPDVFKDIIVSNQWAYCGRRILE